MTAICPGAKGRGLCGDEVTMHPVSYAAIQQTVIENLLCILILDSHLRKRCKSSCGNRKQRPRGSGQGAVTLPRTLGGETLTAWEPRSWNESWTVQPAEPGWWLMARRAQTPLTSLIQRASEVGVGWSCSLILSDIWRVSSLPCG